MTSVDSLRAFAVVFVAALLQVVIVSGSDHEGRVRVEGPLEGASQRLVFLS